MSYRSITVHLDTGVRCTARTLLGLRMARHWGARYLGVAPAGLPGDLLDASVGDAERLAAIQQAAENLHNRAEGLATAFAAHCSVDRFVGVEARVVAAEPVDAVVARARWSDLVIVGQAEPGVDIADVAHDLPQQVILHAACPVLVVPFAGEFNGIVGERMLVAWKDGHECARVLHDALPFLKRARQITVLELTDPARSEAPVRDEDARAATREWLAAHDIAVEWRTEASGVAAGDRILFVAADLSADLIVAGAYGHSRVREWLLGGVTQHLLRHMTVPMLFSH